MTLPEISFFYRMYFCFHSCVLQEDLFAVKLRNSSLKNDQLFGTVLFRNEPGAWAQPGAYEAPWFLWDSCRRTLNFLLAEACGFILEQKGNILVKWSLGLHFRLGKCVQCRWLVPCPSVTSVGPFITLMFSCCINMLVGLFNY